MTFSPRARDLVLTLHIATSVGWLGAALAWLALAVVALGASDSQLVRAAYLSMEPMARFALVPLALASLLSGIVSALGTSWGLFRHYWVVFKLAFTAIATVVLIGHTQSVIRIAESVRYAGFTDAHPLRSEILHAGVGALVLFGTTVLAVFKPRGLTPYGWRKQFAAKSFPAEGR